MIQFKSWTGSLAGAMAQTGVSSERMLAARSAAAGGAAWQQAGPFFACMGQEAAQQDIFAGRQKPGPPARAKAKNPVKAKIAKRLITGLSITGRAENCHSGNVTA